MENLLLTSHPFKEPFLTGLKSNMKIFHRGSSSKDFKFCVSNVSQLYPTSKEQLILKTIILNGI